ncbi:MAG TPA: fatty acid desaturase [Stellaceae bacterium]|nr:fatty acid desaturase [Stellaceae bacterium]
MADPAICFAPSSEFALTLGRRVAREFEASHRSRFADWSVWAIAAGYVGAGALAYALILRSSPGAAGTIALAVLGGCCAFMVMATVGHAAAHGALTPRRWLSDFVLFASFAVIGVSGRLWRDRHVGLHHQLPNLPGTGIDGDGSSLLRLLPHKRWRPAHALQRFYAPLLYALAVPHMAWLEDFQLLAAARRAVPAGYRGWCVLAEFAGAKLLHLILLIAIPTLLLHPPIWALLGTYAIAMTVSSTAFLALTIGTHLSDMAEFPAPNAGGKLAHDWATHQVMTTIDWMPTNALVTALLAAVNADVAHHLFPQYSHHHAALLSRIIAEEAAAHGVPYRKASFARVLQGHWRHLTRLGQPEEIVMSAARRS